MIENKMSASSSFKTRFQPSNQAVYSMDDDPKSIHVISTNQYESSINQVAFK